MSQTAIKVQSGGVAGVIGAVMASYVQRCRGDDGLYELVERVGASTIFGFIDEPHTWFDTDLVIATAVAASSLCYEPDIGLRTGEELVRVLGGRILSRLNSNDDVDAVFSEVVEQIRELTDLRMPFLASVEGNTAVIDVESDPRGRSRFFCRMLVGVFAATPRLWGDEGVSVENQCVRRSDPRCEFTARWFSPGPLSEAPLSFVHGLDRLREWAESIPEQSGVRNVDALGALEASAINAQVPGHVLRDGLTGLANRFGFEERMSEQIAHRGGLDGFGILFLDLDGFKTINDTHGHLIGDAVLGQLGERLVGDLRADDFVVRLGGDEFLVVAPVPDDDAASRLAERVARVFDDPFIVGGLTLSLGCSIGVARSPRDGTRLEDLLRSADAAMYSDKLSRRSAL